MFCCVSFDNLSAPPYWGREDAGKTRGFLVKCGSGSFFGFTLKADPQYDTNLFQVAGKRGAVDEVLTVHDDGAAVHALDVAEAVARDVRHIGRLVLPRAAVRPRPRDRAVTLPCNRNGHWKLQTLLV